jgi:aerobic-type carbon monoxide dehydrogenase small subunit (CoxS/CutS family)
MYQSEQFELRLTINGEQLALEVAYHELLLDVLRDRLGVTSAKRSCDIQICGACTVLVDGVPVSACCTLAWELRGKEVMTAEGLADGESLDSIQLAFIEHFALQCGYCTPGMLMSAKHLLDEVDAPTDDQIKDYLSGNICRCGAYHSIVEAIHAAARRRLEVRTQ